jgi:uncharacterized protein YecE (DUF72 family)
MGQTGQIRIGTSGFSYKEWLGGFYPDKLPGAKMLAYYAERMPTVEINYTFRAMPKREMLEKWAAQTPENFRFALKAPQRITHFARLRGADEVVEHFIDTASALGQRLGPVLFQLPPGFRRDIPLLRTFIRLIAGRMRAAFEFRDPSWFEGDELAATLRESGISLCIAESERITAPILRTAPYVYLRLRNEAYDDAALAAWAERIAEFAQEGAEVFVYFKHEDSAPALALRLRELIGQRAADAPAKAHGRANRKQP